MNLEVKRTVSEFVLKAKGTYSEGHIVSLKDLNKVNNKSGNILPSWFVDLYATDPISASHIDYHQYEPEDDFDGYTTIELATPQNIYAEMEQCCPGILIKKIGYFCIGIDAIGSGDQFFTTSKKGDNPPVFQVYHDVGDTAEEIQKDGMIQIANSISEFFLKARVISKYS
jgi:hypothetical protein